MATRPRQQPEPNVGPLSLQPHEQLVMASWFVTMNQQLDPDDPSEGTVSGQLRDMATATLLAPIIAEFHPDAATRDELRSEARRSEADLPQWVDQLSRTRVRSAVEMRGTARVDNLLIEVALADGQPICVLVRIDHRRGTVVTDADVLGADLTSVMRAVTVVGESDTPLWRSIAPADARARIDHAMTAPRPPVGTTFDMGWQPLRPLLGWLMRLMPEGGEGYSDDTLDMSREMTLDRRVRRRRPQADRDTCEALDLQHRDGMRCRSYGPQLLREVTALAGGEAELASLDDTPLPNEPFDWDGVADDIRPVVEQVLELCDRTCRQFFDLEIRSATRRLLHRLATDGAASFRRKGSVHTAAAALVWVVASRNNLIGPYQVRAKDLNESLAVAGSSSSRATSLLRTLGLDQTGAAPEFAADYLTGERRGRLIVLRDRLAQLPVYRLRVTLDGVEPPIERTVEVMGDRTLEHLHDVLQVAFGWENRHLAQFELHDLVATNDFVPEGSYYRHAGYDDGYYYDDDLPNVRADDPDDPRETSDPAIAHLPTASMDDVMLLHAAEVCDSFLYRYDLGDDWVHTITVESVTPLTSAAYLRPHLVHAARATPPEDIGGVPGYLRLLEALRDGREDEALGIVDRVATPVSYGSFDPWRPDPERDEADAIERLLQVLAT